MTKIKEVSPATTDKAQELASILAKAQELANELVANDELRVLKINGVNIDYLIMNIKYKTLEYRQDIIDGMAHKF